MGERTHRWRAGFSLIELSIVIAIFSTVAVLGLELANQLIARRALTTTQLQVTALDAAVVKFYRVYGRLPCPADRTLLPSNILYGREGDCSAGATTRAGMAPFRTLNLPVSAALDGYNNRINYVVTRLLTTNSTDFATYPATVEVRAGTLQQPCITPAPCSVLADPASTPPSGAAYILFSNGEDKRGAISAQGVAVTACYAATSDVRIDSQNCGGGALTVGIASTVYYDSRYNNGSTLANYFDDVVVWRTKGRMM